MCVCLGSCLGYTVSSMLAHVTCHQQYKTTTTAFPFLEICMALLLLLIPYCTPRHPLSLTPTSS